MAVGSDRRSRDGTGLRRTGVAGIALGIITLLACELPIVLAVIGLGSLSAGTAAFKPPAIIETVGMLIGVIGAALLIGFRYDAHG